MENLFNTKNDIKIVRLGEKDSKRLTDHLINFKSLVLENEEMYPGINNWLNDKVLPGLKSKERIAFVGYQDEIPVVSAVVKRSNHSKFCHLKIGENFQNMYLGEIFFALMALEIRHCAKEIHFTLPESLWESKKEFFKSFGFNEFAKAGTQYRLFDAELRCSALFSEVWKAVLRKLPKLMNHYSISEYSMNELILAIKPKFLEKILTGEKKVEIRRKFAKKWIGHKISLYASTPIRALVGEALIKNVVKGNPESIWRNLNFEIGCTKEDFDNYTAGADQVYAIILSEVRPYRENLPISQISHLVNKDKELKPPQSYLAIENNKPWSEAISVACLLHGSFRY